MAEYLRPLHEATILVWIAVKREEKRALRV